MNKSSIPWPRKGDQLFKSDSDVDMLHIACLNFMPDHLGMYVVGYKHAGNVLVEYVKDTRRYQDTLVYPIVFLYRQYIELRLKELIKKGNLLLDIPKKFPKHHKIDKLWKQCREVLEKVYPEDSAEDLDAVEECIHQFSKSDPTSMAFRYPKDKNDNPSLPGLRHINLRNLSEVMTRVASLLDAASMGIIYNLDNKWEMEEVLRDSF